MTLAKLLGYKEHHGFMSLNEYEWWIARNSLKPLAANVDAIYNARISFNTGVTFSGEKIIKAKDAYIDFYKPDNTEEWLEAAEYAKKKQEERDSKNGKKRN